MINLTFKYKIKDITGNMQILSHYRENSLLQKGNDVPLDDTASTMADQSLLKKYLKAGCAVIANVFSGYTPVYDVDNETVLDPFEFDVADPEIELGEGETADPLENVFIFRASLPDTFNQSALIPMDEAIKDCLENYLLFRISKLMANENESFRQDYEDALSQVRGGIHRRTKGTTRNINNII